MKTSVDVSVNEALAVRREFHDLVSDLNSEERIALSDQALEDPYYAPGFQAEETLTSLATAVQKLILKRQMSEEVLDANETPLSKWDELADIEDEARQAELAEKKKATILKTHSLLAEYSEAQKLAGKKPSVKQRQNLERVLKSGFRERWQVSDLVEEPEQLRTLLEGLQASEGTSTGVKQVVGQFVADRIKQHVKESAAQTGPDLLGLQLRVALEPSLVSDQLADMLIGSYFKSVEGGQTEEIIENYELFIRAILRCADSPHVMQRAIDVARFKTDLLQSELYKIHLISAPKARLDRPELFGRMSGISKAISQIELYLGDTSKLEAGEDVVNEFAMASDAMGTALKEGMTAEEALKAVKDTAFAGVLTALSLQAMSDVGITEYQRRTKAMADFQDFLTDPDFLPSMMATFIEDTQRRGLSSTHTVDVVIAAIVDQYPDMEDFLRKLYATRSIVQDELPQFIKDPASDLVGILRSKEGQRTLAKGLKGIPEAQYGMSDDELIDEIVSGAEIAQVVPIKLEGGFILDWIVETGGSVHASELEIEELLNAIGEERLAAAKAQLLQSDGVRRRHEVVSDEKTGMMAVIRFENEEDRKELHPIDQFTGVNDELSEFDLEMKSFIEESRVRVQQERRRFLSDRGIEYILDADDSEEGDVSIQIHKHPRNPQAFIVTFVSTFEDDKATAQVLMDDTLSFQLGNKKVRSPSGMLFLNALSAGLLSHFTCQEAVETTEGLISKGSNLIARIAHLRLLPEGQKSSFEQWQKCLETEGLDLDVLSQQQAEKLGTTRVTTYVQSVEDDDSSKGPIKILVDNETLLGIEAA